MLIKEQISVAIATASVSCTLRSSYRPDGGLAAARTDVLELRTVVIPALAMDIVCCSMAS